MDQLAINLDTVDNMVINNIELVERRMELVKEYRFTDISARRLLAPGILVMDAKLRELSPALQSTLVIETVS